MRTTGALQMWLMFFLTRSDLRLTRTLIVENTQLSSAVLDGG